VLAFLVHPDFELVELELGELVTGFLEGAISETMRRRGDEHPGTPLWGFSQAGRLTLRWQPVGPAPGLWAERRMGLERPPNYVNLNGKSRLAQSSFGRPATLSVAQFTASPGFLQDCWTGAAMPCLPSSTIFHILTVV
jgi:hypothetical protein